MKWNKIPKCLMVLVVQAAKTYIHTNGTSVFFSSFVRCVVREWYRRIQFRIDWSMMMTTTTTTNVSWRFCAILSLHAKSRLQFYMCDMFVIIIKDLDLLLYMILVPCVMRILQAVVCFSLLSIPCLNKSLEINELITYVSM